MKDNLPIIEPDDLDEQFLSLLERYDAALRSGDTWEARSTAFLTETQRQAWDMAMVSLKALAQEKSRNGKTKSRESTAYLPTHVGRYEIDRILGVGGFSIVYLGRDAYTKRQVAVKIPRPHVLLSPELRDRFVREAQAAAKLDHPHIVAIYEAGLDLDLPYIAYAYCEGSTLGVWVKEASELLPVRQAAELVRALAEAVQYSHDRGILHRDLAPNNVLLTQQPQTVSGALPFVPKIADFGLAKLIESDIEETASSVIMGTPSYMAPEQAIRGHKTLGAMVDVYGLGAIFYFLLTGRPPIVRETSMEILVALCESAPVAPRVLRPAVPRDLETICLKCLEKDPARRYPSAQHLCDDLNRYLSGRPIVARPASSLRRVWQWCQRHPAVAGLLTAVVGAVCMLVVGLIFHTVRVQEFSQTLAEQNQQLLDTVSERDTALSERTKSQELAESRAADLRHALYVTEVGRAAAAWKRGDVRVMKEALEPFRQSASDEPDLREFAWHYLSQQHSLRELFRAEFPVPQWTVRFSPDGSRVAFAGADSVVRLVSTTDFRVVQEIATGQKEINGVIFDPHGNWLATAGDDGTVAVWNLPGGEHRALWKMFEKSQAYQLAFREAENLLLICGQSPDVVLLDFATGETRGRLTGGHQGVIESISLSPDARLLLTCGDDKTVGIWNLATRKLQHKLDGFGQGVSAGAWSEDSQRVAIGCTDYGVSIWDVVSGERLSKTTLIDAVHSIDLTSDGWILAGDAGGAVTVVRDPIQTDGQATSPAVRQRWSLHRHNVQGLAVSHDGRLLATSSRDRQIALFAMKFTDTLRQHVLIDPLGIQANHYEAGPDRLGRRYRISQVGLQIVKDPSAEELSSILDDRRFCEILWRDDNLFAANEQGEILRWDTSDKPRLIETVPVTKQILGCDFLGPNRLLVRGHQLDVGVWNWSERRFERTWPEHHQKAVSRDGRLLALARNSDYSIILYDADSLAELGRLSGHTYGVADLKFSPDGRRLYSCSSDRSIRVWDVDAQREILQLRGHEAAIECLAVTPDEKTLASADETGSVRLWDLRTGREFFELFKHDRKFRKLEFSRDGNELVGRNDDISRLVEFRWSCRDGADPKE